MKKQILCIALSLSMLMSAFPIAASASGKNSAPTVIPAIREWSGSTGKFVFTDGMKVVLDGNIMSTEKRGIIKGYFNNLFGMNVTVAEGKAGKGDISLSLTKETLPGFDGYTLDITSTGVTVKANDETGLFYGVITLLQSVEADGFVPCGKAKDYSEYKIRGGMLDVARAWVPLDYVEEITKYFAWFKLNEIHLHISDSLGGYRLESNIKNLSAKDGYYTKAEYRAYQKRMLAYGIEVVTEIDTPAHSACFAAAVPSGYMLDANHLNISKPEVLELVKGLFDEYLTGDDPVFVSKRVHIGTDEYPAGHNEEMRAYTDALIKHVRSRGYIPRFWGSFGGDGFNGNTPVSSDAEANFWAVSLSDYNVMLNMGYDIINTCGPAVYIVPGGNYGFADYYDLAKLYSTWQVNYMGTTSANAIDPKHKQLLGGSFALWNDLYQELSGFSIYDIFDRVRGGVCLMAEKTWCGIQTKDMSPADFVARYEKLSLYGGDSDPGCHTIPDIDGKVGSGSKAFGWPYTAEMDLRISKAGETVSLFKGDAGELFLASDGSIRFKRGVYEFKFPCKIGAGVTHIQLIADEKETLLVVDGKYCYTAINNRNSKLTRSSTFVLPLESVSKCVEKLSVKAERVDINGMLANRNHALGAKTSVSGLEVDDGRFTSDLAVDGDPNTRLSFARDKDEQWLLIDLGSVKTVSSVEIDFFEHISDYSILLSTDGKNFTEAIRVQKGEDQKRQTDVSEFAPAKARYVKYVQHKRFHIAAWNAYYSGGICEIRVFGFPETEYRNTIKHATELLKENKSVSLQNACNALEAYLSEKRIFACHVEALYDELKAAIAKAENPDAPDDPEVSGEVSDDLPDDPASQDTSSDEVSEDVSTGDADASSAGTESTESAESTPSAAEDPASSADVTGDTPKGSLPLLPIIAGIAVIAGAAVAVALLRKRKQSE